MLHLAKAIQTRNMHLQHEKSISENPIAGLPGMALTMYTHIIVTM